MDNQVKRLIVMQATDRFLIELAYGAVLSAMPQSATADLLRDLRDQRSRRTTMQIEGLGDTRRLKDEINAMIDAELLAFADRLETPATTN